MIEPPMPMSKMPLILRHILVCLLFLAADILFYAPPAGWLQDRYFGDGQDSVAFMWFLNWWPFALNQHLPLLHTLYADWPTGTDLAWKTSVPALGLLLAPLTRQFGALPVFNMLMLASPALSAWGVYLAAFDLVGEFAPALLAGGLFLISGYEVGQNLGHLDLSFTLALPLAVLLLRRAARGKWPAWKLAVLLGPLLAFEGGVSQEVCASFCLFGGAALGLLWWLHPPARLGLRHVLPGLMLGLGLALLLLSPLLLDMLRNYKTGRDGISDPAAYGNDLLAPFIPTPLSLLGGWYLAPFTKAFLGNYCEQGGYFSAPLLVLLAYLVRRGGAELRVCGVMFLAALLAGWGPFLVWHGANLIPGPWYGFAHLPVFSAMLPCRLSLYGWLAASFMLALGLQGAGKARWAAALACLLVLTPAQSADRNWRAFALPPVFAAVPAGAHVLVLPLFGREMGWQMLAGMKFTLVGQGYLGTGRPLPFRNWALFEPLWEANYAAVPPAGLAAYLAHFGVQYVVVLPDGYGFFRPGVDDTADAGLARILLAAAGWHSTDGALFTPTVLPSAAAINQQMALQTADDIAGKAAQAAREAALRHAHALRREAKNICVLRRAALRLHLPPPLLERVYARFTVTPLPPAAIMCPPE